MESNWKQKSIENLEKDYWGIARIYATTLVEKVYTLRTKSIENLTPSDVRLLIGQQVGLVFLIPLALEILKENIFIEIDFYEGDLLKIVLNVDESFWQKNNDLSQTLNNLLKPYSEENITNFKKGKFNL